MKIHLEFEFNIKFIKINHPDLTEINDNKKPSFSVSIKNELEKSL